ncbi:MAG: FmdB family zinc ribbon protein [Dehalococcoidia bacterium]
MPTYAYLCESCGDQYEKRETFSAPARQKCPKCGKAAQRVLFAPPIVFKGSGFYKTDSRGSGSDDTSTPAPTPAAADGHGHKHGAGGHSHDAAPAAPATPASTESTSTDTATEGAAAG